MADAYATADAEINPLLYFPFTGTRSHSRELETLYRIDRFGVKAVLGRDVLYWSETRRMIVAEKVYKAYHSRRQSGNWAEWSEKNPVLAKLLFDVEKGNE